MFLVRSFILAFTLSIAAAQAQTPFAFPFDTTLSSSALNAAGASKANATNPVITGTLSSGSGAMVLRGLGTAGINLGSTTSGNIIQLLAAASSTDTMLISQPASTGTAFSFDATQGAASGGFLFKRLTSIGAPVTLSGTLGTTAQWLTVGSNLSGTNTVVQGVLNTIGSNSDTATPNGTTGSLTMLDVHDRLAAGWAGSRVGVWSNLSDTAATSAGGNPILIALAGNATGQFNRGGVSGGFGTTQFGAGSNWGAVIGTTLTAAATFYTQSIGFELDIASLAGSSVGVQRGINIAHTGAHAVQGTVSDVGFLIADQTSAVAGWKNAIVVGDYIAQWPLDANGYILQTQTSSNGTAPVGAGGFDLNQMTIAGTGPEGGGFFWRSPGVQVKATEAEIGYGTIGNNATGLLIDATYKQMATIAGSIVITAGGTNFTTGDIVADAFGNTLVVTASAGVVTAISAVRTRGWQTSPPSDPVSMTARTRTGSAFGSGLTVTYGAWTAQTGVTIAGSSAKVAFYGATPIVKATPTGACAGNTGCQALRDALGNLGLINTGSISN